jgi:hypothetical protein
MKKYPPLFLILLSCLMLIWLYKFPAYISIFATLTLLLSLSLTVYAIFQKHKGTQNARVKIGKDTLILIFTMLLISFLGGIAGLFTNFYVSNSFGAVAGLICAILAGFVVGYFVRKSVMKLTS